MKEEEDEEQKTSGGEDDVVVEAGGLRRQLPEGTASEAMLRFDWHVLSEVHLLPGFNRDS